MRESIGKELVMKIFYEAVEKATLFSLINKACTKLFPSKSMNKRVMLILPPFFLFALNTIFLLHCEALLPSQTDDYPYISDYSNSVILTILSFYSYYLSGHYCKKYHDIIDNALVNNECSDDSKCSKSKTKILSFIVCIGLVLMVAVMIYFFVYKNLQENAEGNWFKELNLVGKLIYCTYLGSTIYNSFALAIFIFTSSADLYGEIVNNNIISLKIGQIWNIHYTNIGNLLLYNIYYVVFYIVGLLCVVINDVMDVSRYEITKMIAIGADEDVAGHSVMITCIGIAVALCFIIVVAATVYKFYEHANNAKKQVLAQCDTIMSERPFKNIAEMIAYRDAVVHQKVLSSSMGNIVSAIVAISPVIGVVAQIVRI